MLTSAMMRRLFIAAAALSTLVVLAVETSASAAIGV